MKAKKTVLMYIITILSFIFFISFIIYAFYQRNVYSEKYNTAIYFINTNNYNDAIEILNTMQDYKDSESLLLKAKYIMATDYFEKGQYQEAINIFSQIRGYEDSIEKINESNYNIAIAYMENKDYNSAKKIFTELNDYKESQFYLAQIDVKLFEQSQEILYQKAISYYTKEEYISAIELFNDIIDYKDSKDKLDDCIKQLKRKSFNNIIAAGIRNSAVITNVNTIKIVGNQEFGQCDVDEWENIISIDVYGTLIIGLHQDGSVEIAGTYDGREINNLEKWYSIVDIAAGEQFVVGLKEDGTVVADGHPSDGQLKVEKWENVIAIDAGSRFTVALTEDKELLFAGFDNGQAKDFENHKDEWKDVINITASGGEKGGIGGGHTVGLKTDGTLVAVGDNSYGQCDFSDKEKWSNIVKVVAGDWYTVGLKYDGTVVITGENFSGFKYIDEDILKTYSLLPPMARAGAQLATQCAFPHFAREWHGHRHCCLRWCWWR